MYINKFRSIAGYWEEKGNMCDSLISGLTALGVDTAGALRRFVGNAQLYGQFLSEFPEDESFAAIAPALKKQDFEAALTAVHTLKGVSGNLGLTRLFEASARMVALIRAEDYEAAVSSYGEVKDAYEEICRYIQKAR